MYALNKDTGTIEWEFSGNGFSVAAPVALDNTVFAIGNDGIITELDAENGEPLRSYPRFPQVDMKAKHAAYSNGFLFVTLYKDYYSAVHAIDVQSMNKEWEESLGSETRGLVITDEFVIAAVSTGEGLIVLKRANGEPQTKLFLTDPRASSVEGDLIFDTELNRGTLLAYSLATGDLKWIRNFPENAAGRLGDSIVADGVVYVPLRQQESNQDKYYILALDSKTGNERNRIPTETMMYILAAGDGKLVGISGGKTFLFGGESP